MFDDRPRLIRPTQKVRHYAYCAERSGFTNSLLRRLASLGSEGRHQANVHRQLLGMLTGPNGLHLVLALSS